MIVLRLNPREIFQIGRRSTALKNDNEFKFTCTSCGGHGLVVTQVWSILAGIDSERWQEWGPLKDAHHWQFQFKEEIEDKPDKEVQRGDYGEFQEDDSASEPEEYEIFEGETNRESDEFFVNCENCDREIAFGWSQPDRRGLILPLNFLTSTLLKAGETLNISKYGNRRVGFENDRLPCPKWWM